MWQLVDKLLQVAVLTATAATVFVAAVIVWSSMRAGDASAVGVETVDAAVEIRLSSHGGVSSLFAGEPLVVDVALLNLAARRARNQAALDPETAAASVTRALDIGNLPWERRLVPTLSTPGGATVLNTLDWQRRLLDPGVEASGRRLAMAPMRTTLILDGSDLEDLLPGRYIMRAELPAEIVSPDRVRVIPFDVELKPGPKKDTERAVVSLAVARVAALRGQSAQAVEAALTALALDPLQDEALAVVAEGWEEQSEIARAIEWYERYLATLPDEDNVQRRALVEYVEALRQQLE